MFSLDLARNTNTQRLREGEKEMALLTVPGGVAGGEQARECMPVGRLRDMGERQLWAGGLCWKERAGPGK